MLTSVQAWVCPVCNKLKTSEKEALECQLRCTTRAKNRVRAELKAKRVSTARSCLSRVGSVEELMIRLPVVLKRLYDLDMSISSYSYKYYLETSSYRPDKHLYKLDFFYSLPTLIGPRTVDLLRRKGIAYKSDYQTEGITNQLLYCYGGNSYSYLSFLGMRGSTLRAGTSNVWGGTLHIKQFPTLDRVLSEHLDKVRLADELDRTTRKLIEAHSVRCNQVLDQDPKYKQLLRRIDAVAKEMNDLKSERDSYKTQLLLSQPRIVLPESDEETMEYLFRADRYKLSIKL